jgi:hypothetical protein
MLMVDLSSDFQCIRHIKLALQPPSMVVQALGLFSDITGARDICIGGGFTRGLYMQQVLGVTPQMNDIDIFADLSLENFNAVRDRLEREFGTPVRFHVGQFEEEENPCGLIEFALPNSLKPDFAGVDSLQLNFGSSHPWANPFKYISNANLGMNQIALCQDASVIASQLFLDDMTHQKMTMNSNRQWSAYDWTRTKKSTERMIAERPEFKGWEVVLVPKPYMPTTGTFWENRKSVFPSPVIE